MFTLLLFEVAGGAGQGCTGCGRRVYPDSRTTRRRTPDETVYYAAPVVRVPDLRQPAVPALLLISESVVVIAALSDSPLPPLPHMVAQFESPATPVVEVQEPMCERGTCKDFDVNILEIE